MELKGGAVITRQLRECERSIGPPGWAHGEVCKDAGVNLRIDTTKQFDGSPLNARPMTPLNPEPVIVTGVSIEALVGEKDEITGLAIQISNAQGVDAGNAPSGDGLTGCAVLKILHVPEPFESASGLSMTFS